MEHVRSRLGLRDRLVTLTALLATVLSVVIVSAAPAGAATQDVCPTACTFSTISDAIAASADGDTISVGVGTYTETLTITDDLTIERTESSGTVTIDGGDADSVVTVAAGATVTLRNLTIKNGTAIDGGGIHNQGDLTLERVNIAENEAIDASPGGLSRGGGIFNAGTLDIQGGNINSNAAEWGGGIANVGTLTSFGMTMSSNLADSDLGGGGAALANLGSGASAAVEAALLVANYARDVGTAGRGGGALWANGGTVTIEGSILRLNRSDFEAGAVYTTGTSNVTIRDSVIYDSSSVSSAGIYSRASLTIENSTIGPNNVASSGLAGGIRVGSGSTVTMRNSTISGNTADGSGGGAFVEGALILDSVTVTENTAGSGGGVLVTGGSSGGTLTADNSIIGNNTGTSSGPDCWGAVSTGTILLVSDTADCSITGTTVVADPQLGALVNNGGPWFVNTHLPDVGSPALDAGITGLTTDQRGLPRPSGSGPDIGSVEVQSADSPPVITPISDQSVDEDDSITVTPTVRDPESDPFTLRWSGVPDGATTGNSLSWTPAEDQGPGSYLVTVTATQDDDPTLSDSESFTIIVSEVNTAPALDPIADRTATIGRELSFTVTATDPDIPSQDLEYSLGTGAPLGASIDPSSGLFTWTPGATQLGGTVITVVVSDGVEQDNQAFTVTVVEATIETDVFVSRFEIIEVDPDGDGDVLSQTPVVLEIDYGANSLYGDAPDATIVIDYESIPDSIGEFAGMITLDPGPCDPGSGGIGAGEILVCDVGPIASGEVRSFTVTLQPRLVSFSDYDVDVEFGARIDTSAVEPDLGSFDNNELLLLTTVRARQANLQPALAKFVPLFGTPQPVFFGETSRFEMQALNLGPDTALDTTLTLTWRPDAWELASVPAGCVFVDEAGGLTCSYGDLIGEPGSGLSGGPETVVALTETGGPGANHDLTVVAGTASVDPVFANDALDLEVTPEDRLSDVSITDLRVFSGDPDGDGVVRSGDVITYRATIANAGPHTSMDTSILVSFPGQYGSDVEVIDAGGCVPFEGVFPSLAQGLNCDIGLLGQFGFQTIEFTVRIPTDESGLWVLVADAHTGSTDPDGTNDAQADSLEVVAVEADLSSSVSLSPLTDVDQDGDIWLGDTALYTIAAVNGGPDTAENARLLLTVVATEGIDFVFGATFACTPAGVTGGFDTYECPVGDIDPGGFTPFRSAFVPIEWLHTGSFTLRVTAESDLPDLDGTNDASSFVTVVQDPSGDTDGDGIENAIDGYRADPTDYNSFVYEDSQPSVQFSDRARVGTSGAGTTFGVISGVSPSDPTFRIIDDPARGVTVATVGDPSTSWIDLRVCPDDRPVRVWGGSVVDISCGSVILDVDSGRATVTFDDGSTLDVTGGSTVMIGASDEVTVESGAATLTDGEFVVVLEAGDVLADPGGDVDGDGLSGIEETFVGTDPGVADSDGDGIVDAIDVDWLRSAIAGFDRRAFVNNGKLRAIGSILDDIEIEVGMADFEEAAALVRNLRRHSDGCPDEPDKNDWIVDCDVQAEWTSLLDLYRRGLAQG